MIVKDKQGDKNASLFSAPFMCSSEERWGQGADNATRWKPDVSPEPSLPAVPE